MLGTRCINKVKNKKDHLTGEGAFTISEESNRAELKHFWETR